MLKKIKIFINEYVHSRRDNGYLFLNPKSYNLISFFNFSQFKIIPKGYYSQAGQDFIAESLLSVVNSDMNNIKIIDIGANHPVTINNTIYFEKKYNSTVESIEPNPDFYNLYKNENRIVHQLAVGSTEEELDLLIPQRKLDNTGYDDSVHATFIYEELPEIGVEFVKSKTSVKPLDKIVDIGRYNIMFIDVEGFELEVLNGIDFNKFQFDIVIIENNAKNRKISEIYHYMKNKGYFLYGRIYKLDDIYINNDRIKFFK